MTGARRFIFTQCEIGISFITTTLIHNSADDFGLLLSLYYFLRLLHLSDKCHGNVAFVRYSVSSSLAIHASALIFEV